MVDGVTRADLWREHRAWAEHHAKQASEEAQPAKAQPAKAQPAKAQPAKAPTSRAGDRKKIRIGYISPDLRLHSVCYFLIPLLESHDKERFEIFCYSDASNPDQTTSEIRRLSDQWRDVRGKPSAQVHRIIQEDQIDILIDLA
ncbi:MAG: hypothetical protein NTU79_02220, partial [Planctomycetota bacterium]|nr:hypothetical protein [Planctomycetota bacterium]